MYFVGRVLAGVFQQPNAKISIRLVDWISEPTSVGLEVNGVRFGVQLSDPRGFWDERLMQWCDVYAKRSLHPDFETSQQSKVVPF